MKGCCAIDVTSRGDSRDLLTQSLTCVNHDSLPEVKNESKENYLLFKSHDLHVNSLSFYICGRVTQTIGKVCLGLTLGEQGSMHVSIENYPLFNCHDSVLWIKTFTYTTVYPL